MPAKKKKFNARFPPARIKKIMQSDEEVGKVAQVVPVIMSKALETFVASLLHKSSSITRARNARTLTPAHIKSSILSDPEFEFLRELAQSIPDVNTNNEGDELADVGGTGSSGQGNNNNHHQSNQNRLQRRSSQNKNSTQTHHKRGRPKKIVKLESVEKEPSDEEDDDDDDDDEDEEQDIDEDDKDQEQEDKEEFQCSNPSSQFVSFQTKTESKSMIVIEEDNDYDN